MNLGYAYALIAQVIFHSEVFENSKVSHPQNGLNKITMILVCVLSNQF
jgi:hypothetical protein